jgi:hypothetical protein
MECAVAVADIGWRSGEAGICTVYVMDSDKLISSSILLLSSLCDTAETYDAANVLRDFLVEEGEFMIFSFDKLLNDRASGIDNIDDDGDDAAIAAATTTTTTTAAAATLSSSCRTTVWNLSLSLSPQSSSSFRLTSSSILPCC